MSSNKKMWMIVLLLVVGFASVSTSLFINGVVNFSFNEDDFKVYFSESLLDGEDVSSITIFEDGKNITYKSSELSLKDDKSTLDFIVSNTSKIYDANVSLSCNITSSDESINVNDYVSMEYSLDSDVVIANSSVDGRIIVSLDKVVTESVNFDVTCNIVASPVERDSKPTKMIKKYSGILVDDAGNLLNIPKGVIVADSNISVSIYDGEIQFYDIEPGTYELYHLVNSISIWSIPDMTVDEIVDSCYGSYLLTVTEDGFKLGDFIINDLVVEMVPEDSI